MDKTKSELWGGPVAGPLPSWTETFHGSATRYSDNIALICAHQDAGLYDIPSTPHWDRESSTTTNTPYLRWTYSNLKTGVDRLAAGLRARGFRPGTAIITLLPNCAEFVLTWWAAMQLGEVMAPLGPRRLANHEELSHMLQTIIGEAGTQPHMVIAWDTQYLEATAFKSLKTTARIVVGPLDQTTKETITPFAQLMAPVVDHHGLNITHHGKDSADIRDGIYRDCSIVFTSGSTSLPKGVRRSYPLQKIVATMRFKGPGFETLPGDLWCAVAPNNHTVGISGIISLTAFGAGVVYLSAAFSAESTAYFLERERCSHIISIPTMVKTIADVMRDRGQGPTQLKTVVIAASPPTEDTLHDAFKVLGAKAVFAMEAQRAFHVQARSPGPRRR
jgi:acyl-CoA synthetase (AMP-forming)/AMP-acid ligase II